MRWNGAVPAAALLVLLLVALVHGSAPYRHHRHLPAELWGAELTDEYVKVHGFGPGLNGSWAFAFTLSEAAASSLADSGVDGISAHDWPTAGNRWRATPATAAEMLSIRLPCTPPAALPSGLRIRDYLDCRWHGDPLDPAMAKAIDAVMNAPGGFYSNWRAGGLVVVAPDARRVYLVGNK